MEEEERSCPTTTNSSQKKGKGAILHQYLLMRFALKLKEYFESRKIFDKRYYAHIK